LPVSIITAIELVQGSPDAAGLRLVQRLLSRLVVLPVTEPISLAALHLLDVRSLSHGLRIADTLIAATALAEGIPLYSKNVRHFQGIPGLTVIRPY
jgi:predicted nucleic acid-binding protein